MGSLTFFGQVLYTTLPTVSELAHHKQRWPQRFYSGGEAGRTSNGNSLWAVDVCLHQAKDEGRECPCLCVCVGVCVQGQRLSEKAGCPSGVA